VVGEDRNWSDTNAFFQSTVDVEGISNVTLQRVEIVGPSQATLLGDNHNRAPTAVRAGREGSPDADQSVLNLQNVLVVGHGSFLSNPIGEVHSKNVSVADLYGIEFDDHFAFLQTPHSNQIPNNPTQRRFTFEDSIFYQLMHQGDGRVGLAVNGDGVPYVYFDPSSSGGNNNLLVRAQLDPNRPTYYIDAQLSSPDLFDVNGTTLVAHGVYTNDDTTMPLTGNLVTDNSLNLVSAAGFDFLLPDGVSSGWLNTADVVPEPSSLLLSSVIALGAILVM
jgi:hypothetical protein